MEFLERHTTFLNKGTENKKKLYGRSKLKK